MGVKDWFVGGRQYDLRQSDYEIVESDVQQKDFAYEDSLPGAQSSGFNLIGAEFMPAKWSDCQTFAQKAELLLSKCPVSRACIEMRAQGLQNITLKVAGKPETEKMLASPNKLDRTTSTYLKNAEIGLSVGGDLYVFYDKRVPGLPQMHAFRQDLMDKNVAKKRYEYIPGKLSGNMTPQFVFYYDAAGKTTSAAYANGRTFDGALQHISYYDPINPLQGAGAGDSAIRSAQNYLAIDDLIKRKLDSGGAKNGYFKTQGMLTDM